MKGETVKHVKVVIPDALVNGRPLVVTVTVEDLSEARRRIEAAAASDQLRRQLKTVDELTASAE